MILPKSLQIQTIDYCNRACPWCPNSYMKKSPSDVMSDGIYLTIMEDLQKLNYTGAIHLYLMAEPLCDPRIEERIEFARSMFPKNTILILTNGDYLNGPDHTRSLFKSGLTWMVISDYDQKGNFAWTAPFPDVDVISYNALEDTFYNRGGNIDVECNNKVSTCEWVAKKAYINYKGDVILCCSDYNYKVSFGNVLEMGFGEIYNSDKYKMYRKAHAMGRGKRMPLCRECNRIQ